MISTTGHYQNIQKVLFHPRPIFDLVMPGQRSTFGDIDVFSTLQDNFHAAVANITMKPLPSYFSKKEKYFLDILIMTCGRSHQ